MRSVSPRIRQLSNSSEDRAVASDNHRAVPPVQPYQPAQGYRPLRNGIVAGGPSVAGAFPQRVAWSADEIERFLHIVWKAPQIKHHYELFLLLQGEIQRFISHQIFIGAWGQFDTADLTLDVVSAEPGVRTGQINSCLAEVKQLLANLRGRWLANNRRSTLLNNGRIKSLTASTCTCALHKTMSRMQSILVHGVHDSRTGTDSLYVALSLDSAAAGQSIERFLVMVDPIITQIDVAFRRVSALAYAREEVAAQPPLPSACLSFREQQVMKWVTEGGSNSQIGRILGLSTNTVKNHLQRIFRKFGAANRTEAVSKYRQYRATQ